MSPLSERRWRPYMVPVTLWLMLWGGLNARPVPLDVDHVFGSLDGLRAALPLAAGVWVVWLWFTTRPVLWRMSSPLGLLGFYAAIGLLSSLALSPRPALALYWAGAYSAVLPVLWLWMAAGPDQATGAKRLIQLNWVLTGIVGLVLYAVAEAALLQAGIQSFRHLPGVLPMWVGMPMVRQTGLGRFAAVMGIVAFARLMRRSGCSWWAWSAVFLGGIAVTALTESRAAVVGLVVGLTVVVILNRRTRFWALVGCVVLCAAVLVQMGRVRGQGVFESLFLFLSGRPATWLAGLELFRDSPIFGLGFHADRLLLEWPFKNHLSNAWLHALAQTGLVGAVPFLAAWVAAWTLLLRALRRTGVAGLDRAFLIEVAGVLAFLTVRGMFESTGAFFGVDWLLLAPLCGYAQAVGRAAPRVMRPMAPDDTGRGFEAVLAQPPVFRVLGTRVHAIELEETVAWIERWIAAGERGRFIVASGMHGIMEARRDPDVRALLNRAALFVPDGFSLLWLARRRGFRLTRRACGAELLRAFCARAAQRGFRVFFYGDEEAVLARLTGRLTKEFPGLHIAGSYSPPFRLLTTDEDERVVRMINASSPDVVWVGLGLPKQERWVVQHRERLSVPVFVGVGAAFKFVSGAVPRAPRWMGEHGLEWAWRFAQEPRRLWRRALLDVPQFTVLSLLELAGRSWGRPRPARTTLPRHEAAAKRLFDLAFAGSGLIASLPLWVLFGCLVKAEDGGSVFYVQERVGRGGRRFRSLKFRTMVADADARYGPRQARPDDERITRIGRLLRATAMDELPQLWNILKGDMSFVGPRALAPTEVEVNGNGTPIALEAIPGYEARHRIRPGLTGITQIYVPRDVPRRRKFRYDQLYATRQRFWLDVKLIVLSFWITFRGAWERRTKKF